MDTALIWPAGSFTVLHAVGVFHGQFTAVMLVGLTEKERNEESVRIGMTCR